MPDIGKFKALVVDRDAEKKQVVEVRELSLADLMEGDVVVRVSHSTVNYKDGLAITGKLPVVRRFPMIPGVDFCGTVETSADPNFTPGDHVILNGWGCGETHYGAYAKYARVKGDWLIRKPDGMSSIDAMAIGTAGYTAMLSILALEHYGITPESGPMVVTGAVGGVGSVAIALLKGLGYQVIAVTGRGGEQRDYLTGLGADEIVARETLADPAKMLDKERWAGGIDAVGSNVLANVIAMTKTGGAIAACGNAGGMGLSSSVAPFILRGVSLLGINSATAPRPLREEAWARLVRDLDRDKLEAMMTKIGFDQIRETAEKIIDGKVRGRVVVEIG
jgi:acrylyl-CoA reductase (NADPH)